MADAVDAIDQWIAQIREIKGLAKTAAPAVAEALLESVQSDLAAGVDPATGKPWPATKDGGRPLKNAAGAVVSSTLGTTVQLKVTGHHFYHHTGKGHGPVRNMLPQGSLSGKHARAVTRVLEREFKRIVK